MSKNRRAFFKDLLAIGAIQGFAASPAAARVINVLDDPSAAQEVNPDFDAKSYDFWCSFLSTDDKPISRVRRGKGTEGNVQPLYWHFDDKDGFRKAVDLDASRLIPQGDVIVSLNTTAIKVAPQDQIMFNRLENAQVRVDVAQKNSILPSVIEPLGYTFVSAMMSLKRKPKPTGSASGSSSKPSGGVASRPGPAGKSSVQSLSDVDDPTWQKMQNILLPGGEGRWALNVEAQKKDSLFHKIIQNIIGGLGKFAPLIGLPGIAMSALQSFNTLYGAIHASPVQIIQGNHEKVYATQDAVQKTGVGKDCLKLKSGYYVLFPEKVGVPDSDDEMQKYTVIQGRVVPRELKGKSQAQEVDIAAAETLPAVTYVTFQIEVQPTSIISSMAK